MAIIDRDATSLTDEQLEHLASGDLSPSVPSEGSTLSSPARVLIASLSAAAGVIHLVMVPSHAGEWLPEGIAFAAAGWLQLALAVLIVSRPSRNALRLSCAANAVFVGAWAVTRIWGSPFGPEAGVPHAMSFVDVVCVALEAALVVAGLVLLAKPSLGSGLGSGTRQMLAIVPVGIFVLATAAIASPGTMNHAHGGGTDDHGVAAADHGHGGAAAPAGADDHHADHAATPVDDKGLSKIMNGAGEGGGHVHSDEVLPVDAATQAQLDAQLAKMQPLIEKYPTVAAAEAAGYHRSGPYAPGLGAHYGEPGRAGLNLGPAMTDDSLGHPMLIFDGVAPDSKLAGFMYMIFSMDTENAPEGFVGPNDHWHYHTNVCIKMRPDGSTDAPLGADTSATKEMCDKYQGFLVPNTGYMVHVWPVKGYESPQGMFSNLNPKMTCPNGTYHTVSQEEIGTRTNICKDVPA